MDTVSWVAGSVWSGFGSCTLNMKNIYAKVVGNITHEGDLSEFVKLCLEVSLNQVISREDKQVINIYINIEMGLAVND